MTGPRGYAVEGTVTLRIPVDTTLVSTDPQYDAVTELFKWMATLDSDELTEVLNSAYYDEDLSVEPWELDGPSYD